MSEFILLMHNDAPGNLGDWESYLGKLCASGRFLGGSSIGGGICCRKEGLPGPLAGHFTGYLRIEAADLQEAQGFLVGNPHYESGGTVEIRELPKDE